jgi:hypothetical protein
VATKKPKEKNPEEKKPSMLHVLGKRLSDAIEAVATSSKMRVPVLVCLSMVDLSLLLDEHGEGYNSLQKALFDKYGEKDEEGNVVIPAANLEDFNEALKALGERQFEVPAKLQQTLYRKGDRFCWSKEFKQSTFKELTPEMVKGFGSLLKIQEVRK